MNDNGIAWMIAGGVRAESAEDQRQRLHRVAIAQADRRAADALTRLRARVAAIVAPRARAAGRADGRRLLPRLTPDRPAPDRPHGATIP